MLRGKYSKQSVDIVFGPNASVSPINHNMEFYNFSNQINDIKQLQLQYFFENKSPPIRSRIKSHSLPYFFEYRPPNYYGKNYKPRPVFKEILYQSFLPRQGSAKNQKQERLLLIIYLLILIGAVIGRLSQLLTLTSTSMTCFMAMSKCTLTVSF